MAKIRIRISNPRVEKYLTDAGKWSTRRVRAKVFQSEEEAHKFAMRSGIRQIGILLEIEGERRTCKQCGRQFECDDPDQKRCGECWAHNEHDKSVKRHLKEQLKKKF